MADEYDDEVAIALAKGFSLLANAITPIRSVGATDASGCYVESLTEAVMGLTSAVFQVAKEIEYLSDLVKELKP